MYEVIHEFADLLDNNHVYRVGDVYPRDGGTTTLERATELMGKSNKIGKPVIKEKVVMETKSDKSDHVEPEKEQPKKGRGKK